FRMWLHAPPISSGRSSAPSLLLRRETASAISNTLSLHDALPIFLEAAGDVDRGEQPACLKSWQRHADRPDGLVIPSPRSRQVGGDRKSTRLNSSHLVISYAVFCLKKKMCNRLIVL